MRGSVLPGLEVFLQEPPAWAATASLGLLCHPASLDRAYRPAPLLVARRFPGRLKLLFSPQHGLKGEKQDNMVSSPDFRDPLLGIPVLSLYGPRLEPPLDALQEIEVLLVDLMDVGTRVYTYGATLAKVMAAAARTGVKVVVLDRPNPIGGVQVKGTCSGAPAPPWWGLTLCPCVTASPWGNWPAITTAPRAGLGPRGHPAGGWRRQDYFDATGSPGSCPPQPPHLGRSPGLPRAGAPGEHQPVRGPRHHPALRALRRPVS